MEDFPANHASPQGAQMFQNAQIGRIEGGTFINVNIVQESLLSPIASIIKFLKKCIGPNPLDFHRSVTNQRTEGTGQVFISQRDVQGWKETKGGVLWAPGGPGTGKTYLASSLFDSADEASQGVDDHAVAIYYLLYSDQLAAWKVVMALIIQLVESKPLPAVVDVVLREFTNNQKRDLQPSLDQLSRCLRSIATHYSRCDLFLDGLDEMPRAVQLQLLDCLLHPRLSANVCLTSQELEAVCEKLDTTSKPVFVTPTFAAEEDLNLYITEVLIHNPTFAKLLDATGMKTKVFKTVKKRAKGRFIHVKLQMDALVACATLEEILDVLERPSGIEALYAQAMERIRRQPTAEIAKQALTWIVFAVQPLSLEELRYALASTASNHRVGQSQLPPEDHLLQLCGGLVTVYYANDHRNRTVPHVCLVHLTALKALKQLLHACPADAHRMMALSCLNRLATCGFQKSPITTWSDFKTALQLNPFLSYAYHVVSQHVREAAGCSNEVVFQAQALDFVQDCACYPYNPAMGDGVIQTLDNLRAAIALGLFSIVEEILKTSTNRAADLEPEAGWTGLMIAAAEGDSRMVELLLTIPAVQSNRTKDHDGLTALLIAANKGHIDIVKALVDHGRLRGKQGSPKWWLRMHNRPPDLFGVNVQDRRGRSPLMEACSSGNAEMVKILLATPGVDVNLQDRSGTPALVYAAERGKLEVLKILITTPGIHLNLGNKDGMSALICVSSSLCGSTRAANLLLADPRVDINLQDNRGKTALMHASWRGRVGMLNLLLAAPRINVALQDNKGRSALMHAVRGREAEFTRILLAAPAVNINLQDKEGKSALMHASWMGSTTILAILLAAPGVDVNLQDKDGCSAMMHAASGSFAEEHEYCVCVEALLSAPGVDVNLVDNRGRSALAIAVERGHNEIESLLRAVPEIQTTWAIQERQKERSWWKIR